jgi:hypothetical protein
MSLRYLAGELLWSAALVAALDFATLTQSGDHRRTPKKLAG